MFISYTQLCLLFFFRCIQQRQYTIDLLDQLGGKLPIVPDISEDCLYLNIYTPANRARDTKLPVRTLYCMFEMMLLSY